MTALEIVLADSRPGTAELAERAEALERRIALLDQLKPDERTTLILIGFGFSYAEIGELRGWSLDQDQPLRGRGAGPAAGAGGARGEKT